MQSIFKRRLQLLFPYIKRVVVGLFMVLLIWTGMNLYQPGKRYSLSSQMVWDIILGHTQSLKQANGRTNILLLGAGGGTHDGADLTDTIMVLSVDFTKKDALLIVIPRDIWIPTLKEKINSAYHFGEEKTVGGGLTLSKATVEEVVGIPIHYGVLVTFSGFQEVVDVLEGIDVAIGSSFTDSEYPILGKETDLCGGDPDFKCRFETVTFTAGTEHMDGERALKYVRSRHAEGNEGSDFSRGKRQQAVIMALKKKVVNWEILSLEKIENLMKALDEATTTDLSPGELLVFGRMFASVSPQIRNRALVQDEPDKERKGMLISPPLWEYGGRWVLVPKHGDFKQIGEYVNCVLENTSDCESLVE